MQARCYKIYAIDGVVPVINPTAFVHPDAVLIGDTREVRTPEASDHSRDVRELGSGSSTYRPIASIAS